MTLEKFDALSNNPDVEWSETIRDLDGFFFRTDQGPQIEHQPPRPITEFFSPFRKHHEAIATELFAKRVHRYPVKHGYERMWAKPGELYAIAYPSDGLQVYIGAGNIGFEIQQSSKPWVFDKQPRINDIVFGISFQNPASNLLFRNRFMINPLQTLQDVFFQMPHIKSLFKDPSIRLGQCNTLWLDALEFPPNWEGKNTRQEFDVLTRLSPEEDEAQVANQFKKAHPDLKQKILKPEEVFDWTGSEQITPPPTTYLAEGATISS